MINEMHRKSLNYVREYLIEHNGINSPNPLHPFRSRYHHTIRVLHWCFRLAEDIEGIDKQALYLAAIFHDIGYTDTDNEHHALRSGEIFHKYAREQQMDSLLMNKIERMIYGHSNKELLQNSKTMKELIILLEADLLDEEGVMGIVWDCMTLGNAHVNSYGDAYYHIMESSNKPELNPMVTERAKHYWEEKKKMASVFAEKLKDDLMIGSEYFEI
ncbi:MAG: HD domain-containing protein [Lachnospiraceae bacterium]